MNWMICEMIQPSLTIYNCNSQVQDILQGGEDSFDEEDQEDSHKIKTKAKVHLKVKTESLSAFAKRGLKNWERDVLELLDVDVGKYVINE